jgi:hypothetical protein
MSSRPLYAAAFATAALLASSPISAQEAAFFQLGWEMSGGQAREVLERGGFRAVGADSSLVFERATGSLRESLSVRLRDGRVWHVYYTAQGDSVTVQRVVNAASAAATRRWGSPANDSATRAWRMGESGRFVLPSYPLPLEDGSYAIGIVYHRP